MSHEAMDSGRSAPLAALVTLRVLVGWHFLYEGLVKLLNPHWTAADFLAQSQGIFSGAFHWLVADPSRLAVVDTLNGWGLVLIGVGLMAGLLTRFATLLGMLLLALYYVCQPPFPQFSSSLPAEGSYLVVNKVLIELVALWVLLVLPTGSAVGLDRLLVKRASAGGRHE
jgi:thiosulfate dehydrogenase [quinone] large subunit